MKRAIIIQGLGFGDEGKGATVDFLTRELNADLVVRYCGGSQAGHNVVLPDGRRHVFSHFGAGTLAGAATYLGEAMIINPPAMRQEAKHLQELTGEDPFLKLLIHPSALVSTVYHQQVNRLRELSRGANRHGSCGHGIGETRHYWLKHGRDAICAADLKNHEMLSCKLELLRQRMALEVQEFIALIPSEEHWRLGVFMEPTSRTASELLQLAEPFALQAAMPTCNTTIFEGAQGVLLDEWRGFHPYTTWSTVTLHHALALAEQSGAEEVCTMGVTRSYLTRHGAGPLPTQSPELNAKLADPGNPTNSWQGQMRHGCLDHVLLRYAVETVGGTLESLAVNCLDDLPRISPRVCTSYRNASLSRLERLPVSPGPCLAFQERLTQLLEEVTPVCEDTSIAEILDRLESEFAPIALTATGPTWKERTLRDLRFRGRTEQCERAAGRGLGEFGGISGENALSYAFQGGSNAAGQFFRR